VYNIAVCECKISAVLMIKVIKVKELILNCSNKSSAIPISLYVTNQHNNVYICIMPDLWSLLASH